VTLYGDGTWAITKPGSRRASATAATQAEAIQRGSEILNSDGVGSRQRRVHGRGGQIRDQRTIAPGHDPGSRRTSNDLRERGAVDLALARGVAKGPSLRCPDPEALQVRAAGQRADNSHVTHYPGRIGLIFYLVGARLQSVAVHRQWLAEEQTGGRTRFESA